MFQKLAALFALLSLFFVAVGAPAEAQEKKEEKKEKASANIAHIHLHGELDEMPVAADPLLGTSSENFKSKIDRIHKAANDKGVQALLIHVDGVAVGWAKIQELKKAIEAFRKTGRKAYAYLDSAEAKDFLLATSCDVIAVPESGWVVVVGVRAEVSFYKELLDKLGIRADFIAMGVYKFAAEPYTRSKMSPEARSQFKLVIDDFFDSVLVGGIARGRAHKNLSADKVAKIIDEGPFSAKRAKELGLIDHIAYEEGFEELIKKDLSGKYSPVKVVRDYGSHKHDDLDLSNPFTLLKVLFAPTKTAFRAGKDRIAIIYAVGAITTGKGGRSLMGGETVGSTTIIEALRKADADSQVKAIVLRVDSPGGSALASDLIWREIQRCKKPVVASMSDVAASGGYYISMGAKKIYAQPGTLTGSIGVVGGKLALAGLYDKVGITTETISRGANSGIFSSTHPFSPAERKALEKLMEDTYDQFLTKAMAGRAAAGKKFTRAEILKVAEGRIWTGKQALDLGLIDSLGSLDDAIGEAKVLAGLARDADTDYLILPKARSFMDSLLEKTNDTSTMLPGNLSRLGLGEAGPHLRGLDALLQLRGEPVWMIVPHGFQIK